MDGVIVDSTNTHTLAWQQYLAAHGIEVRDLAARMIGKHNNDIVEGFFPGHDLTESDIVRHGAAKEALYRDLMRPILEQHLVPGIREFLQRHTGSRMGVA